MISNEGICVWNVDGVLLALQKQRQQEGRFNRLAYYLPATWRYKIDNKIVLCVYFGKNAFNEVANAEGIAFFKAKMNFLQRSIYNTKNVIMWWLDDGLLYKIIEEHKRELSDPKQQERLEKILIEYEQFIQVFMQHESVVYDNSGDIERVVAWSDGCFAEESALTEVFRKAGKLICSLKLSHIGDGRIDSKLFEWLKGIIHERGKNEIDFYSQVRHKGKKVILAYVCNAGILRQGSIFFEVWYSFLKACKIQGLAVWWLCDASLSTMVEYMKEPARDRYLELRKWAESDNDIFIDMSGDIDHAIGRCDAYYGSPASCAVSEAARGMPVVWYGYGQGWPHECRRRNGHGMLMSFIKGCWIGDEYYFAHWYVNGLFRIKRGSEKAEFVTRIPFKSKEKRFLSAAVFHASGFLYVIPTSASEILAWEISTGKWQSYELDPQYAKDPYVWFIGAFKVDDCLWLKPVNYAAMVRFDLASRNLAYFTGWGKQVWDDNPDASNQYWGEAVFVGSDIWIAAKQSRYIMKFSTELNISEMYEVENSDFGIRSLAHDGTDFWIYTVNGDLLCWHPQKGVHGLWKKPIKDGRGGSLICKSNRVWLFEHLADSYVMVDIHSGELSYRSHFLPEDLRVGLGYAQLFQDENYIYIHPNDGELLICFNPETERAEVYSFRLKKEDEAVYAQDSFENREMPVGEGLFYDLYELIMYLRLAGNNKISVEMEKSTGQAIYDRIVQ